MDERDRLLLQKEQLEQLIRNKQDRYSGSSGLWNGGLSSYSSHPADTNSHLQVLNNELERINAALEQYHPQQLS